MSVTTRLKDSTIDVIHELVENNYHDADIYEFINTYGEDALETCYEDYVELGESFSFEAVDVFCDEFSIEEIGNFQDAYYGEYETPAIFAENSPKTQLQWNFLTMLLLIGKQLGSAICGMILSGLKDLFSTATSIMQFQVTDIILILVIVLNQLSPMKKWMKL